MGAFAVGFVTGGLWFGAKPFDWPSTVIETLFTTGLTVWFTIRAVKGPWK